MSQGIYSALSGAVARQHQLDVVSHNLANVDSAGFRAQRLHFSEQLVDASRGNVQVRMDSTTVDETGGVIEETGNELDVAIHGQGYLEVMSPSRDEVMMTRDGRLDIDTAGRLTTRDGLPLVDRSGNPIYVGRDGGQVTIGEDGTVWRSDGAVGTLSVVEASDSRQLTTAGSGLLTSDPKNVRDASHFEVLQGHVESSNVEGVHTMTEMITLHRYFEAMERLIQQHNRLDQRAVTGVGRAL